MKERIIKLIKSENITFKSLDCEIAFVQGWLYANKKGVPPNIWVTYLRSESIINANYK